MASLVVVEDYQKQAKRVLPRMVYDYYSSGADDEVTLRRNKQAYREIVLRPRVLRDVTRLDLSTTVLGQRIPFPLVVAPTAMQRMAHPDGEEATARACAARGTVMTLSSWATTSLEDVAAAAPGAPRFFQLYVYTDRKVTVEVIRRAEQAGYSALMLTVDTPRLGRRIRDVRNRFQLAPHLSLKNFTFLGEREGAVEASGDSSGLATYVSRLIDASLNWDDIKWLRSVSKLPIILKGIMTGEDAALAADHGVDAIIVSNHGARQLDTVSSTIEALPEVVRAVGGRCEVYVDGGITRGTDILKAVALGARAVLIGRPVLWGLACDGEAGVRAVLETLEDEYRLAMTLAGLRTTAEVTRAAVRIGGAKM